MAHTSAGMAHRLEEGDKGELSVLGASYVEAFVSFVRDRAVRPVLVGARVAVIALVAGTVALLVAVAVVVGLVRLFTSDVFGGRVWATDLLFGGIFATSGMFLMWLGLRTRGGER